MGVHSDSPRSPGCGDFNNIRHRLDQGSATVMPRYFKISQGHPVSVFVFSTKLQFDLSGLSFSLSGFSFYTHQVI
jgi:hypothetical protein